MKDPSAQQTIDGLDYYTSYNLKTYLTYNLGQSDQESTEVSTKDFQLDYKKLKSKMWMKWGSMVRQMVTTVVI